MNVNLNTHDRSIIIIYLRAMSARKDKLETTLVLSLHENNNQHLCVHHLPSPNPKRCPGALSRSATKSLK